MSRWLPVRFVSALFTVYTLAVLLFFALRAVLAEWPAWLVLVNSFAPLLFVPLPLAAFWVLVGRSRKLLISVALALLVFALLYGSHFLPRAETPVSADALTVMTFNLGPGVSKPEAIVAAIRQEDPDLIVMQELTPPTAKVILASLGARYPFGTMDANRNNRGILSRYPIQDIRWLNAGNRSRETLVVRWTPNGRTVRLFAPHLAQPHINWANRLPVPSGMDTSEQERIVRGLVARVVETEEPVLMMGDFNMTDQGQAYATLTAALRDSFREAGRGFGFTFPNGLKLGQLAPNAFNIGSIVLPVPLIRIDYIFHSTELQAQEARVECAGTSDHCYVVAKLAWR